MGQRPFFYSNSLLKLIAENYVNIYEGLPLRSGLVTNPWALAEFKADFDIALNGIGRGEWTGTIQNFEHYHYFGLFQRIIIADILGIEDQKINGCYNANRSRSYAYYLMSKQLN